MTTQPHGEQGALGRAISKLEARHYEQAVWVRVNDVLAALRQPSSEARGELREQVRILRATCNCHIATIEDMQREINELRAAGPSSEAGWLKAGELGVLSQQAADPFPTSGGSGGRRAGPSSEARGEPLEVQWESYRMATWPDRAEEWSHHWKQTAIEFANFVRAAGQPEQAREALEAIAACLPALNADNVGLIKAAIWHQLELVGISPLRTTLAAAPPSIPKEK